MLMALRRISDPDVLKDFCVCLVLTARSYLMLRASFSLVTVTKETSLHFGVVCAIVSERRSSVFLELGLKFALAGHLSCDSTFLVWPQSSNSMPGRSQRRCMFPWL